MIELLFELITGILKFIISLIVGLFEIIASLFLETGLLASVGEFLGVLFVFVLELILWPVLFLVELVVSLSTRRKTEKVSKPIIWRPKHAKQPEE